MKRLSDLYTPTRPQEIDAVARALFTVGPEICYLSTPVTGGHALLEYKTHGHSMFDVESHRALVLSRNRTLSENAAKALRRVSKVAVINPASVLHPGWADDDYMCLWLRVIQQHAGYVMANEGWYVSAGCVVEVAEALLHHVRVYDAIEVVKEDAGLGAKPMTLWAAKRAIAAGQAMFSRVNMDTSKHAAALEALEGIAQ